MPPMILSISEKKRCTVGMQKAQAYITRLFRCLSKLEKKYSTPTHKRKPRLFKRKERTNTIVPKEFSSIFDHLAQPDPNDVKQIPGTIYPEVKWNLVKFKPVSATSSLWLELSSLLQLPVRAILLQFLYY